MEVYIEKIEWLKEEIEKSPKKLKYLKYKTFLGIFGMKQRRNFKSVDKIDDLLKQYQISYWKGRKQLEHLSEFAREDTITFRILNLESEITSEKKIKYPYAGAVKIVPEKSNLKLYKHQIDAVKELNDKILVNGKKSFAGLLVLPTGGGKTLTAIYWLLKNYTNNNKKILWIAHRHELLEQAKYSFEQLAYSDILKNRSSFNYRIISGLHDKPVNIRPTDDIIISSKDSLNKGFNYLYENWINYNDEIFLVIDEAHHATAKTYRSLINQVKANTEDFRMMGLTATPFRTAKDEKGLLKKVFPDDIIYKIDLRTLISRGILSEPIFEEIKTDIDMTKVLDEKELDNIKYFDIDTIGKSTAKTIAENKDRNHCIVDQYIKNKSKYKKTIVFALNIDNAIALNSLFNKNGVKSEYVVSSIRDGVTGVSISNKDNKEKIERFRSGDLDVLVNVNILTEGTDLPETQTVFLARPTISSVLMTQMIGRGLRGIKAGGTKNAYIVSFIDEWQDKVAWVNPKKLLIEEEAKFPDDDDSINIDKIIRLVSIEKIEEFADIMDKSVNTDELESLEFIERVPIGLYSFSILKPINGEEWEKNCEILVYNNIKQSYYDFINSLPDFFENKGIKDKDTLSENELEILSNEIEENFFYGSEKYPGYIPEDIKNILSFYAQKGIQPDFIKLEDREKFNLTNLAKEIKDKDMRESEKWKFLEGNWDKDESEWKVFFGFDKKYFINEVDLILHKLKYPDLYKKIENKPENIQEKRPYEKLSMSELREYDPIYWKKLSDGIFGKYRDKEGYYHSAISDYKSKSKLNFQIDHIIPISQGGLTKLENLQLLTRKENALKNDKLPSKPFSLKQQEYKNFWDRLVQVYSEKNPNFKVKNPYPQSWLWYGAGKAGLNYLWAFSDNQLTLGLHIGTPDAEYNDHIFNKLFERKNEIEENIGKLLWHNPERNKTRKIWLVEGKHADVIRLDEDKKDDLINWAVEWMLQFKTIFDPLIQKIE